MISIQCSIKKHILVIIVIKNIEPFSALDTPTSNRDKPQRGRQWTTKE